MAEEYTTEEIDYTKTLISIIIALFSTVLISSLLILPKVKELKIEQINTERQLAILRRTKAFYSSLKLENEELYAMNEKTFRSLERTFDQELIEEFGLKQISIFTIVDKNVAKMDDMFYKYELKVKSKLISPVNFYNFLDSLGNSGYLLKIGFPIEFTTNDNLNINIQFKLNVYSLLQRNIDIN